jgi:hypothetical protein
LIEQRGANPSASLPRALKNDAALEAGNRFFNNASVTPQKLLEPHIVSTLGRM